MKKFLDAAVKNTAVEKGAPLCVTATTEGWLELDHSHKGCRHNGDNEGILKLTDKGRRCTATHNDRDFAF